MATARAASINTRSSRPMVPRAVSFSSAPTTPFASKGPHSHDPLYAPTIYGRLIARRNGPLIADLGCTGCGPAGASGPRVLVDWHSHYASSAEVHFFAARGQAPRITIGTDGIARLQNVDTASFAAGSPAVFTASDIPARLRHLDRNGIPRQLLTQTVALGLDATIPLEELRPLLRAYNDELAGVIHRYPGGFFGVAALPTGDPEWAAAELERGHRDLGFIGGSLPLNAFATLEGARAGFPVIGPP